MKLFGEERHCVSRVLIKVKRQARNKENKYWDENTSGLKGSDPALVGHKSVFPSQCCDSNQDICPVRFSSSLKCLILMNENFFPPLNTLGKRYHVNPMSIQIDDHYQEPFK